ncbi:MAG: hypothetical protein Q8Q92_03240 [bacterium]|nr:hypothetical protein [bacterium]
MSMIISNQREREKKVEGIMKRLLAEKGITHYIEIPGAEEASEILPGGIYPVSGKILTDQGRLFYYWLDWDPVKNDYSLGDVTMPDGSVSDYWREVDPSEYEQLEQNESYQNARKKLGLK